MVGRPHTDIPAVEKMSEGLSLATLHRDLQQAGLLYLEIPSGLLGRAGLMFLGAGTGKVSGPGGREG